MSVYTLSSILKRIGDKIYPGIKTTFSSKAWVHETMLSTKNSHLLNHILGWILAVSDLEPSCHPVSVTKTNLSTFIQRECLHVDKCFWSLPSDSQYRFWSWTISQLCIVNNHSPPVSTQYFVFLWTYLLNDHSGI